MSLFNRLLRRGRHCPAIETPDDGPLKKRIETAKRENRVATHRLVNAAHRHERDALMVRQVIHDVLKRADLAREDR